jgi:hypothetical protein
MDRNEKRIFKLSKQLVDIERTLRRIENMVGCAARLVAAHAATCTRNRVCKKNFCTPYGSEENPKSEFLNPKQTRNPNDRNSKQPCTRQHFPVCRI